jgi:hypothetical protein
MIDFSFFFIPAVVALVAVVVLFHDDYRTRWRFRPRNEAEERALALLRSWLTPEQDRQWRAHHQFEVVGCDTGTRYRIKCRAAMNIHQLDAVGNTVAQWCFMPQGGLAAGDVLLAQKIALETMERQALAVANSQRLVL